MDSFTCISDRFSRGSRGDAVDKVDSICTEDSTEKSADLALEFSSDEINKTSSDGSRDIGGGSGFSMSSTVVGTLLLDVDIPSCQDSIGIELEIIIGYTLGGKKAISK